jgi:integrase
MAIAHLDEKYVRAVKHGDRDVIVRDDKLAGFLLRIGKTTKTFSYRSERGGKAVSIVLGQYPQMKVEEARTAAERARNDNKRGVLVNSGARAQPTIDNTWPKFKINRIDKARRQNTLSDALYYMTRLSDDVRTMPLRKLTNSIMLDEIARIRKTHGPMAGNNSARFVRALYRFARVLDKTLPDGHPCEAVVMLKTPPQPVMPGEQFAAWHAEVEALKNPIHREAYKFALLSGLRKQDLLTLEWEHLNREAGTIRIPNPKGGPDKAFDLVLSRALLDCLDRAREAGLKYGSSNGDQFVFPSDQSKKTGRVRKLGKLSTTLHTLRRSYGSAATVAGVPEEVVSRLLNHRAKSLAGQKYILTPALRIFLRDAQEVISQHIEGLMHADSVTSADFPNSLSMS